MYLCYIDETGMDAESDAIVTVGIVVDATTRLVKVNREWTARLEADESKIQGETVEFLLDPPEWADEYYQRGKKQDPFDQLVHTPFYVKSHHVGIVQLADLVAFVYRRYLQVVRHGEAYDGELHRLTGWVERLNKCLLPPAARTPKRRSGPGPELIGAVSPAELP